MGILRGGGGGGRGEAAVNRPCPTGDGRRGTNRWVGLFTQVSGHLAEWMVESGSGSPQLVEHSTSQGDPAAADERNKDMRAGIHPEYVETSVTCGCGNTF